MWYVKLHLQDFVKHIVAFFKKYYIKNIRFFSFL